MTNRTNKTTWYAIALTAAALASGCQSDNAAKKPADEFFYADGDTRHATVAADAQARRGAKADATLQDYHFDAGRLNSLGESKLDLLAHRTDADEVTTVYLNFPETDEMNHRRDDVVAYMRSRGMSEANLKFVSGPNPATFSPAAGHIARMDRTENVGGGAGPDTTSASLANGSPSINTGASMVK
jgi:hypothetical protein